MTLVNEGDGDQDSREEERKTRYDRSEAPTGPNAA